MKPPKILRIALAVLLTLHALPGHADERASLEALRATTLNLIQALVESGVLSKEKAASMIEQAGKGAATLPTEGAAAAAPAGTVRVPYVPQFVREQIRDEVKQDVMATAQREHWAAPNAVPEWLDRISFGGEMTLRGEDDIFRRACTATNTTACNVDAVTYNSIVNSNLANTTDTHQYTRLRALFGAKMQVNPKVDAEVRFTTGNSTNPVTNFQTLGNTFGSPVINLDRGLVDYRVQPWLEFKAGRMPNPWFSTDLLWYDRLSMDGMQTRVHSALGSTAQGYLAIGAFAVQDLTVNQINRSKSKWLYASQFGGDWALSEATHAKAGLAYYDFVHVEGIPNANVGDTTYNATAPAFLQKGNSLFNLNQVSNPASPLYGLASKFRELDLVLNLDTAVHGPVHVGLIADAVKNLGFDANEIAQRTMGLATDPTLTAQGTTQPLRARTRGYMGRLNVGYEKIRNAGEWQTWLGYKYLQRDAVMDAFNDPDFHLGGTDAKGYLAGVSIGLEKDTWATLKYYSASAIDGPPLNIDVIELDLNLRF